MVTYTEGKIRPPANQMAVFYLRKGVNRPIEKALLSKIPSRDYCEAETCLLWKCACTRKFKSELSTWNSLGITQYFEVGEMFLAART